MTAMITNEGYGQQVTSLFDMLKLASPEQLQTLAQTAQQNPDSPEATALAMATQYQQQANSPQAPTQTVFQQKIAQLQQRMNPMQGGITDVGANQYAMQDAAQQDPMRNAGIGAAPENAEPAPESMEQLPGAATGGIVALAHGGPVRHFAMGGFGGLGDDENPELGTEQYPYEEDEEEDTSEMSEAEQLAAAAEREYELGTGDDYSYKPPAKLGAPKQPKQDTGVVNPARPGSSAERIQAKAAQDKILESSVEEMMQLYGPSYAMSNELQSKFETQLADANKEKWFNALAQGIGGMLSAQTPHLGQAAGAGLLAGAAGYQQGAREEADLQKQMLALQLAGEKERHADRRAAVGSVTKQISDAAAARKKLEGQKEIQMLKNRGMFEALQGRAGTQSANTYATTAEEVQKIILDRAKALKDDPHSAYYRQPMEDIISRIGPQVQSELKQQGAQFNPRTGDGGNQQALRNFGLITGGGFFQ